MFKRIAQVPDFEIEVLVALPGDAEDPPVVSALDSYARYFADPDFRPLAH